MSSKHGISAIANEVICDIQKEAIALIEEAEKTAKETLKTAKEEADQNYQAILAAENGKIEAEKRRIASVTEVEMRNRLLQTKEDLVDLAFEKALAKFKTFAKSKQYPDYLLHIIEASAKKMGQQNLVVHVNAKDKKSLTPQVLTELSEKLHCELQLSEEAEDYIGGCKIQTADSKIIYDCTIDNRFQELKPVLRFEVAKMLFGAEI